SRHPVPRAGPRGRREANEAIVATLLEHDGVVLEMPRRAVERRAHLDASNASHVARHPVHRRALPRGADVGVTRDARGGSRIVGPLDVAAHDVAQVGRAVRTGGKRRRRRARGHRERRQRRASPEKRRVCGTMANDGVHGEVERVYLSAGKGPPKPPPKSAIGLTEVERAISVLEGRHPEHEKLRRQTRAGIDQRRGEIEIELARKARARRLRALLLACGAVLAGVAVFIAWRLVSRTRAVQAALDATEAPWLARGFTSIGSNVLTAGRTLDVDLPGGGGFVGLAASDAPLRATLGGARAGAGPPVRPRRAPRSLVRAGRCASQRPPLASRDRRRAPRLERAGRP